MRSPPAPSIHTQCLSHRHKCCVRCVPYSQSLKGKLPRTPISPSRESFITRKQWPRLLAGPREQSPFALKFLPPVAPPPFPPQETSASPHTHGPGPKPGSKPRFAMVKTQRPHLNLCMTFLPPSAFPGLIFRGLGGESPGGP
jgi:hypothetical protein